MSRQNKKKYIFFAGLASFALVGGIAIGASVRANGFADYIVAHAEEESEEVLPTAISGSGENFSWSSDKGTNPNPPIYHEGNKAIRLYGSNTFTISSSTRYLKSVSFETGVDQDNKHSWDNASVNKGGFVGSTGIWTASDETTTSFTLTNGNTGGGHLRILKMTVTYVEGSHIEPTTSSETPSQSEAPAGTTIVLGATQFSKLGETEGEFALASSDMSFKGVGKKQGNYLFVGKDNGYICNTVSLGPIERVEIKYAAGGSSTATQLINFGESALEARQTEVTNGQTLSASAGGDTGVASPSGNGLYGFFNISLSGNKNLQIDTLTIVLREGEEPTQSSEEPAPTPEQSSEEPAPTSEQSSEEPTPTPEESSEEISPSPTTSSEEPVVSSSSKEEPPQESSVTPSDKATYDFTTNFETYSNSWKGDKGDYGAYGQRTVTNTDLGVDLAGSFAFEFASRQTGETAPIKDRPVIANKTIDPKKAFGFSLTDESLIIGSVKITFANWNTKAPTLALFAGNDIVGEALDSVTIGENALTLETDNLGASSFSVSYAGHGTQNWQVGISAVEITLKGEGPAESSSIPEEESSEIPAESSEVPVESSEAPEETSYVPTTYSEDALRFGERFIKNITCDGGVTAPSVGRWDRLADLFHELGQDDQEAFMDARANENGNAVEAAVARYDFIIHKYGTKSEENPEGYVDFMSRFTDMVNVGIINRSAASNSNRRTMAIVTTTVFGAALLGAGLIAFSLKRKHKEDK